MRAASAVVFGIIWLIIVMVIGFTVTASLISNVNMTEAAIGADAAGHWTTFVSMIWIGFGILALTPLVLVALMFMGLFGGLGGRT